MDHPNIPAFVAIQKEFRTFPSKAFSCRLLHWDPELEKIRMPLKGYPDGEAFQVYWPLDWRVGGGGKPKVFFWKVHKTNYPALTFKGTAQRQFGITYNKLIFTKTQTDKLLREFTQYAEQAGALVASAKERFGLVLPQETLAVKNDMYRWILTVYDVAWKNSADNPLSATKYIPVDGFNGFMGRDESIPYDLKRIRSIPWSQVKLRCDDDTFDEIYYDDDSPEDDDPLETAYLAWQKKLPEYYASRLDDIVQASDLTIDWLLKHLR